MLLCVHSAEQLRVALDLEEGEGLERSGHRSKLLRDKGYSLKAGLEDTILPATWLTAESSKRDT